jgi:hypothetical protein
MKKCLSLLLVAITAVSVLSAAGVVTATKTDAKPVPSLRYAIPYGVNQKWVGSQCNWHFTFVDEITTAKHFESSVGNTAFLAINAAPGETGWGSAGVGVKYTLTGITSWADVKDRPIALTVKMTYVLAAKGNSLAWIGIHPVVGAPFDSVNGKGLVMKTVTKTFSASNGYPLTVSDLAPAGSVGNYDGWFSVGVQCGHPSGTGQQAFASVMIQSLSIQYL